MGDRDGQLWLKVASSAVAIAKSVFRNQSRCLFKCLRKYQWISAELTIHFQLPSFTAGGHWNKSTVSTKVEEFQNNSMWFVIKQWMEEGVPWSALESQVHPAEGPTRTIQSTGVGGEYTELRIVRTWRTLMKVSINLFLLFAVVGVLNFNNKPTGIPLFFTPPTFPTGWLVVGWLFQSPTVF